MFLEVLADVLPGVGFQPGAHLLINSWDTSVIDTFTLLL